MWSNIFYLATAICLTKTIHMAHVSLSNTYSLFAIQIMVLSIQKGTWSFTTGGCDIFLVNKGEKWPYRFKV